MNNDASPANWFSSLPTLGILTCSGQDALKLLQGQTTCDIAGISDTSSTLGALCTPQGRVLALIRALRSGTDIHLLLPRVLLADVQKKLRMYVLRADVHIEDTSARWVCLGMAGIDLAPTLSNLGLPYPQQTDEVGAFEDGYIVNMPAASGQRLLFIVAHDAADALQANFQESGVTPVDASYWHLADIRAGLPEISPTNVEAFVPQMLNLDRIGGISFTKGCYTGQEIVARTHYLGSVKRRMYRLEGITDTCPEAGEAIFQTSDDKQNAGTIVTAAPTRSGGLEMLAVLNVQAAQDGHLRLRSPQGDALTLLSLPYPLDEPS